MKGNIHKLALGHTLAEVDDSMPITYQILKRMECVMDVMNIVKFL